MEGDSQDWRGMSGAVAWHLIDRHAEGWKQVGDMMEEWLRANGGELKHFATPPTPQSSPSADHVCTPAAADHGTAGTS